MSLTMILLESFIVFLILLTIYDLSQRDHSLLRNFPVVAHFRYFAEWLGVYLRSYLYARDREELPFNRIQRSWVYKASKNVDTTIGFGSSRDISPPGTIFFVDAPFAVLDEDHVEPRSISFGPYTKTPYSTSSIFNISAMSYGAISRNAVRALSHGAKKAGCWMDTGEGGITPYHLESGCDIIAEIGTGKFGYRYEDGRFNEERLKKVASYPQVKMFELKLSQGAKPGKGGLLPAAKVDPEIAEIRGIKPWTDCQSPNRFPEISNCGELLDFVDKVRTLSGKPTGIKFVVGEESWIIELCELINKRGIESAPDFFTIDGAEGGTGAAPLPLADYVGLSIMESLPMVVDILIEHNLRDRIRVIASGKLVTPGMVAWALAMGADAVNSARGFMFSLGCVQSLKCNTNRCPTGITTHNPWLMRGLDPTLKAERVASYQKRITQEVGVIAHACGVKEPRELTRKHVRMVTKPGKSKSFASLVKEKKNGKMTDWLSS